jgi:hypothetical protein
MELGRQSLQYFPDTICLMSHSLDICIESSFSIQPYNHSLHTNGNCLLTRSTAVPLYHKRPCAPLGELIPINPQKDTRRYPRYPR